MNLALQHWPQRCPIGLNVITQVVAVVAHVNGHAVINLSRSLVPQRSWIPIVANRSVRGVPNLNLLPRPAVATQHRLSLAELLHGNLVPPPRRPHDRPQRARPRSPWSRSASDRRGTAATAERESTRPNCSNRW